MQSTETSSSAAQHTPGALVVVFPRGQLGETDKARAREFGVLAMEADDPTAVSQLHLAQPLVCTGVTGDALVAAAVHAIASAPTADRNEAARTALRFITHLDAAIAKATATGSTA